MKKILNIVLLVSLFLGMKTINYSKTVEKVVQYNDVVATHVIADGNTENSKTVIMLHGFASSRDEVGGLYKNLADSLAKQGINSIRVDFRGFGDTTVKSTEATATTMIEDAQNTYNYLKKLGVKNISVQGFSLGSDIAILTFSKNKDIKNMVLWSTPKDIMDQYYEIEKKDRDIAYSKGIVNLDLGWRKLSLSKEFFESLKKYDVMKEFAEYNGNVYFIAGGIDELKDDPFELKKSTSNANIDIFIVKGGDHIYHSLDDDQTQAKLVVKKTTDWFRKK